MLRDHEQTHVQMVGAGVSLIPIPLDFSSHRWLETHMQGSLIPAHAHTLCAGNLESHRKYFLRMLNCVN